MSYLKRLLSKFKQSPAAVEPVTCLPFDTPYYSDVTEARLRHLEAMNLPLAHKTVIDLGCGIGRIAEFFAKKDCDVFCVDGREENIQNLKQLYPGYKSALVDLETQDILNYGKFDVVACYGILYHLSDPFAFIKNVFQLCSGFAIIETCITDAYEPMVYLVPERQDDPTQALIGVGCRPSPAYVVMCLKLAGFQYVYEPKKMPEHTQFRYQPTNDFAHLKNGNLIRGIYIAAHQELDNPNLRRL